MSKSGPMNCGNVNMKGKKAKLLSCRCCCCLDLRDKLNEKLIRRELQLETCSAEVAIRNSEAAYYEGYNWDYRNYYDEH